MQVTVEKTSELKRKMTVSIPDAVVQEKMENRFKALAREVKVDGFRPGKAPTNILKKLYGERVKSEITGDLIQSTYFEALQQQNLEPAGQPHIQSLENNGGFEYIAEFEVYPEILLDGINQLQITRPVATVTEADVDNMIAKLRLQKKTWTPVERVSAQGDRVTLNFSGVCEGENFTDGKVENYQTEIGLGQMIPGFEDELLGLTAGAAKTFSIKFPENYGNEKLAGKVAEFDAEITAVEEPTLPALDAEFIQSYGVESADLDDFRADVKLNMERELGQGLKTRLKSAVLDALYANIAISTPTTLVDQEIQNIIQPYADRAKSLGQRLEDLQLPVEVFENHARRRVALSLIMGEIIQKNGIKIDDVKVRAVIEDMAKSYEVPEDVIDWYYADNERLNDVKQMVLEDQTIDWIISQVIITDEQVTFSDVMEKPQVEA